MQIQTAAGHDGPLPLRKHVDAVHQQRLQRIDGERRVQSREQRRRAGDVRRRHAGADDEA